MKMKNKILASAFALIGFAATTSAQSTTQATATATVITPITITKNSDMSFGNLSVQAATAGTVVLTPAGGRSRTLGVTLPATTGTVSAATFTVNGTAAYTYAITLPGTVTLTRATGTETMTADNFTSTPSATGTLTGGTESVAVGATLNVAAGQLAGVYTSANFDVTVNYN
jgi:hypothetical protein